MAFPQAHVPTSPDVILRDPGAYFESPMEVVWEPHLDHDARIRALEIWLDRERMLYRADRAMERVARMRQIESAIRTLRQVRHQEGAY
jgi:hypothetical protein